jgi:hypothetical protein
MPTDLSNKANDDLRRSVFIAYCHNGLYVRPQFLESLDRMKDYDYDHLNLTLGRAACEGSDITGQRNEVVRTVRTLTQAKALLFIDSDMQFEPDLLYTMMAALDPIERPIIVALAFNYLVPNSDEIGPVWYKQTPEGYRPVVVEALPDNALAALDAAGTGCMLIHMSAFDRFPEQPDGDPWRWFGRDLGMADGKVVRLSEDVTFTRRARALGIPVTGFMRARVDHWKSTKLNLEAYLLDNERRGVPKAQKDTSIILPRMDGSLDRV